MWWDSLVLKSEGREFGCSCIQFLSLIIHIGLGYNDDFGFLFHYSGSKFVKFSSEVRIGAIYLDYVDFA